MRLFERGTSSLIRTVVPALYPYPYPYQDLGEGEWRKYVCVEAAQIGSPVKVSSPHNITPSHLSVHV